MSALAWRDEEVLGFGMAVGGQSRVLRPTTAYEMHTCLAEVLDRGTADQTFTDLGVKKFDLGGKTGTAYNFTDLWFVGYSSAVT